MKRGLTVLWTLALLLCLPACGKSGAELTFTNKMDAALDNLYISPNGEPEWQDSVSKDRLKSGSTLSLAFKGLGGEEETGVYDVGGIDGEGMNYDMYGVTLSAGDAIVLAGNGAGAVFTVTHADGTVDSYEAVIYPKG